MAFSAWIYFFYFSFKLIIVFSSIIELTLAYLSGVLGGFPFKNNDRM